MTSMTLYGFWAKTSPHQSVITHGLVSGNAAQILLEGHAEGIMTSYNVMNGLPTSENADLLRGIVRGEWGYEGFITTDWGNGKNQIREINASNNVHTPYASEEPHVEIESDQPVTVVIYWDGGSQSKTITAGK